MRYVNLVAAFWMLMGNPCLAGDIPPPPKAHSSTLGPPAAPSEIKGEDLGSMGRFRRTLEFHPRKSTYGYDPMIVRSYYTDHSINVDDRFFGLEAWNKEWKVRRVSVIGTKTVIYFGSCKSGDRLSLLKRYALVRDDSNGPAIAPNQSGEQVDTLDLVLLEKLRERECADSKAYFSR